MFELGDYLEKRRGLVNEYLTDRIGLKRDEEHQPLWEAVEYSLLSSGKRIRPILALAAAEAVGGDDATVLPFACAIEMVHAYSLIHDDLPCMDNDDLRRGQPACHMQFDEATALLAGDALLTMAFELMTDISVWEDIYHHEALEVIQHVAKACGPAGMVGGQVLDLLGESIDVDEEFLRRIHMEKTGALIEAAIFIGARLSGADTQELKGLKGFADAIGLAFQIRDDLLDVTGDEEEIGKPTGSDEEKGKATFPAILGEEASVELMQSLCEKAVEHLTLFSRSADPLRALAQYVAHRSS